MPPSPFHTQRLSWEVLDTFAEAAGEVGIPTRDQFDNSNEEAVGYFVVNQKRGFRLSAYRAFLNDAVRARPNLKIVTGAKCKSVVLDKGKNVQAVEFWVDQDAAQTQVQGGDGQRVLRADVMKEAVLAAGSIGSPHILQVSGTHEHGYAVGDDDDDVLFIYFSSLASRTFVAFF